MKTADRGNPNRWATRPAAEYMGGRFRTALVHFSRGCEERKIRTGGLFFLTSSFIEQTGMFAFFDSTWLVLAIVVGQAR
jgi:hypothetical protein